MTKRNWELLGNPSMTPSLGGIGIFRGKLINLCGKLTNISLNANGTLTKEYFEIVKFNENSAPFTILLGKPWIERDRARRKEEEEVLEDKKKELKEFKTRRIAHLIEEQKNRSKLFNTKNPNVEVARTLEEPLKIEVPIPDEEEGLPLNLRKESQ